VVLYHTPAGEAKQAAAGLNRAKGYMRSYLAAQLNLRAVPDLVFKHDIGAANQARIEELLREDGERDEPASD
jgi:ribosome-binding factor A